MKWYCHRARKAAALACRLLHQFARWTVRGAIRQCLLFAGGMPAPDGRAYTRASTLEGDTLNVEGLVTELQPAGKGAVRMPSAPQAFRWIDRDTLSKDMHTGLAPFVLLQLGDTVQHDVSKITRVPPPALDEGPHQSYAVQWFAFAARCGDWVWRVSHAAAKETETSCVAPMAERATVSSLVARERACRFGLLPSPRRSSLPPRSPDENPNVARPRPSRAAIRDDPVASRDYPRAGCAAYSAHRSKASSARHNYARRCARKRRPGAGQSAGRIQGHDVRRTAGCDVSNGSGRVTRWIRCTWASI